MFIMIPFSGYMSCGKGWTEITDKVVIARSEIAKCAPPVTVLVRAQKAIIREKLPNKIRADDPNLDTRDQIVVHKGNTRKARPRTKVIIGTEKSGWVGGNSGTPMNKAGGSSEKEKESKRKERSIIIERVTRQRTGSLGSIADSFKRKREEEDEEDRIKAVKNFTRSSVNLGLWIDHHHIRKKKKPKSHGKFRKERK
ncbi:hypothetical protein X777_16231 [Ooceraea biroi]|uniref:Uncharacterized protein n=1 Tax=Ooceraea biroi TaxID=2015173 RepID=A0A026WUM9_OOCBI|nr:hypothetical protein X777_16231 [Ooceraea biroi]